MLVVVLAMFSVGVFFFSWLYWAQLLGFNTRPNSLGNIYCSSFCIWLPGTAERQVHHSCTFCTDNNFANQEKNEHEIQVINSDLYLNWDERKNYFLVNFYFLYDWLLLNNSRRINSKCILDLCCFQLLIPRWSEETPLLLSQRNLLTDFPAGSVHTESRTDL